MEIFTGLVRVGLSGNLIRSERVVFTDGGFVELEDFESSLHPLDRRQVLQMPFDLY